MHVYVGWALPRNVTCAAISSQEIHLHEKDKQTTQGQRAGGVVCRKDMLFVYMKNTST